MSHKQHKDVNYFAHGCVLFVGYFIAAILLAYELDANWTGLKLAGSLAILGTILHVMIRPHWTGTAKQVIVMVAVCQILLGLAIVTIYGVENFTW